MYVIPRALKPFAKLYSNRTVREIDGDNNLNFIRTKTVYIKIKATSSKFI